jgi:ribose transport system substrate-binding protein
MLTGYKDLLIVTPDATMKPLHCLAWAGATLALVGLIGCQGGGSSSTGKPRVAFVSNNAEAFWTIAEAGAKKAAGEFDVELYFRKPATGDVADQKQIIDTVLNQGIKALAVSVIDPKNQRGYLDEIAGKVSLITQDNDAPQTKRLAYIGTDNYAAGRAAGKLVKEALGEEGGHVVIFVGDTAPLNARQRRQGVIDEVAGRDGPKDINDFTPSPEGETAGKFKFYKETITDQPEGQEKCRRRAKEVLAELLKTKEPICLVGLWAYNPPAMLGALKDEIKDDKERQQRVKIVAFDENSDTLSGIRDGDIYATVVQDPYGFGYESVKLMSQLARGDKSKLPKDGIHYVPHRIIAREAGKKNGMDRLAVGPFREDLEKKLGGGK